MPTPEQLKSLADEYDVALKTVKKYEKEAEKALKGQYDKDSPAFHGTAYTIIENKLKKHSSLMIKVSKFLELVGKDYA